MTKMRRPVICRLSHISTWLPPLAAAQLEPRYTGSIQDHHSEQAMLRFTIAIFVAMAAIEPAASADRSVIHHGWHRTTVILPPGLPRPHYRFRTTITYRAAHLYRRPFPRISVYENPADLYAPDYTDVALIRPYVSAPIFPGYYGSSYTYEGPYYGGPYAPYWDRLPYACGVYGYC
jgi:hypothetical protein